ncbi:solute carrier family 15, member 5 [Sarotherodon galilaeus]
MEMPATSAQQTITRITRIQKNIVNHVQRVSLIMVVSLNRNVTDSQTQNVSAVKTLFHGTVILPSANVPRDLNEQEENVKNVKKDFSFHLKTQTVKNGKNVHQE